MARCEPLLCIPSCAESPGTASFVWPRGRGWRWRRPFFGRDEVYTADEAFFSGTAAEVTPIREVDGRAVGKGEPGPITKRLQSAYFEVVNGEDESTLRWLTEV